MYSNNIILSYIFNYIFFYNMNILILILIIILFNNSIKYLNNLVFLNYSSFYKNIFIISIFSISGIPPFLFFFNKLNIIFFLTLFSYKNIIFLYIIFFLTLYFYIQSLRYMLSDNNIKLNVFSYFFLNYNYFIVSIFFIFSFLNLLGFSALDDIFLIFIYLIN